ncbi:ferric reductase NAD binding domain-containing protein [Lophiotrema nucula]|uniref:Ferric reductase NAD binding domain-containing protein n=1 Tax=Lophiotrema nucula TaxID=690887 RepID=A0A6A5YGW8_9PLEO|nr:ferric reductase NAD binding domain-containing protein [Lophiotrema nucula]
MPWPFHFIALSDAQVASTRRALDRYGLASNISPLAPVIAYLACRAGAWLYYERFSRKAKTDIKYTALSVYPGPNSAKLTTSLKGAVFLRKFKWWLASDVLLGWGKRSVWVASLLWTTWLLFLSLNSTQADYKHVTKRIAIVAVAQMPLQYIASMRWRYSPLALLFEVSHQEIVPYHRALGRIIYTLCMVHAALYLNLFIQQHILVDVMFSRAVITGVISAVSMSILVVTSTSVVRIRYYRIFYLVHFVIGSALPLVLIMHASHLRIYVIESFLILMIDMALRKFASFSQPAAINPAANGRLVRITMPLSEIQSDPFRKAPGSHVYLSLATPSKLQVPFSSPFSVQAANVDGITLMLRTRKGPVIQNLKTLAISEHSMHELKLEGPYGSARHFPNFATDFSRSLLIAGGIGATFILPVYQSIQREFEEQNMPPRPTKFIWVAKTEADVAWATSSREDYSAEDGSSIDVFLTGRERESRPMNEHVAEEGTELQVQQRKDYLEKSGWSFASGRPDLRQCVDDFFHHASETEPVAVLVCGPRGLVRDLRSEVGRWVDRGQNIWWHEEHFG